MPYNNFKPVNSSLVPTSPGNTLSEYEKLFSKKQEQYDFVTQAMTGTSDMLGGLQFMEKDKGYAKQVYDESQAELAAMAKQGDLENMIPRVGKIARKVASEAKPLSDRFQQQAKYVSDLTKEYEEGKITKQQRDMAIAASNNLDRGMQRDEITGRLKGTFQGMRVIGAPDTTKVVDEALKGHTASSGEVISPGSDGIYRAVSSTSTREVTEAEIAKIVKGYMGASKDYQSYFDNVAELETGTNLELYQELNRNPNKTKEILSQMGQVISGYEKDKKGNPDPEKPIYMDAVKYVQEKGIDPARFVLNNKVGTEKERILQEALGYAIPKYKFKQVNKNLSITEDVLGRENRQAARDTDKAAKDLIEVGTIGYTGLSKDGLSPDQIKETINQATGMYMGMKKNFEDQYLGRDNTGFGAVYKSADGKWLRKNEKTGEVKDVSSLREDFSATKVAEAAVNDRKARDKQFREMSGVDKVPLSLIKQAETARNEARVEAAAEVVGVEARRLSNEEVETKAQAAYNKVMRSSEPYKKYEKLIADDTKFKPIYTNMVTTADTKTLDGLTEAVNNMVAGLGENSAINAMYFSGDNSKWGATQLQAADWKKLQGQLKVAGMQYSPTSPSGVALVVRALPGSENTLKGKAGENMLIELPVNASNVIFRNNPAARQMFEETAYVGKELNQFGGVARIRDIEIRKNTDGTYTGTKTPKDGGPTKEVVGSGFQQVLTDLYK